MNIASRQFCHGIASVALLLLAGYSPRLQGEPEAAAPSATDWQVVWTDSGTGNWEEGWFLDGLRSQVHNTAMGMVFAAGTNPDDDGSHDVLWTKREFAGDLRLEYDFTRLDSIDWNVVILYLQARGIGEGPYHGDLLQWRKLREVPAMSLYVRYTQALHLSYAAFGGRESEDKGDYLRMRRYPRTPSMAFGETEIPGTFFETGLFRTGIVYRMEVEKTDAHLRLRVTGDGQDKTFAWDLRLVKPVLEGRIGFRHMACRTSRYANLQVSSRPRP